MLLAQNLYDIYSHIVLLLFHYGTPSVFLKNLGCPRSLDQFLSLASTVSGQLKSLNF